MMSELGDRPKLRFQAQTRKKRTRKIGLQRIQLLSSQTPKMLKKHVRLWNRSIIISELGAKPKLRFLDNTRKKRTCKIGHQLIQLLSSRTPQKWLKKHVRLWNHSIMMSELGARPKLRFWAWMSTKKTQKIGLQRIQLLSSRIPQKWLKKTCQALESLNTDVRASSQAQSTILGLDEHETDTKHRTSRNSASKLTNPLEMVKKNMSGFGIAQY